MNEVSFIVKPDSLSVIQNTVIEANFEECKAALNEMMQPYKTMVVTGDAVAAAKNDRARIRKVSSGIDDMRKAVKKAYTEPLKAFEEKCRQLTAICDEGAANLDRQVKDYEKREADAKIARIREVYDGYADAEEFAFLPWDAVYNARWANKGVSEDDAKQEIHDAFRTVREDLETIRGLDEQDVPYLLDYYRGNQSIREVLRKANELKARREAEIQRKAAAELARIHAEERRAEQIEQAQRRNDEDSAKSAVVLVPSEGAEEDGAKDSHADNRVSVVFRVIGTREQLNQLKVFMQSMGIGPYRA